MLVINEHKVLQAIKTHQGICEITVQAPEGLRRKALELASFLEDAGYTVYVSATPCYGACDIREYGDLVVHVGHTRLYSTKIPVVYAEVADDFDFVPTLQKNLERIPSPVGLLTTAQHRLQLPRVRSFLSNHQIESFVEKGKRTQFAGQILGCDLSAALSIRDKVEGFLFLGTGMFHPLGAAVATRKDVFQVYHTVEKVNFLTLLKQRHALIFKASQSNTFGVVLSTKKGQYRKKEALEVKDYLESNGKTAHLFIADDITPQILHGCDAYIICACPRIALDDAALYDHPVLTCKEAYLMFERTEYTMDMIV